MPRRHEAAFFQRKDNNYMAETTLSLSYRMRNTEAGLKGPTGKLIHTTRPDHTKQSCLCRVCFSGVNWIPDNWRLSPTENMKSEHVNGNCSIHTAWHDTDRTVLSCLAGGVNRDRMSQSCPWVGLTHGLGWVKIFQFLVGCVGLGPLQQKY